MRHTHQVGTKPTASFAINRSMCTSACRPRMPSNLLCLTIQLVLQPAKCYTITRMKSTKTLLPLLLSGLATATFMLLPGCSGLSFSEEWTERQELGANTLAGYWSGVWHDERNGSQGRLRCIIRQEISEHYNVSLCIPVLLFYPSVQTTTFQTIERGNLFHFSGIVESGLLWNNEYEYKGKATNDRIYATFQSASRQGTVELQRSP